MSEVVVAEVVEQRWLSYEQAASYTSLDARTLRRLVAEGGVRASRPRGGRTLIDRRDLDRLLEERLVVPAEAP